MLGYNAVHHTNLLALRALALLFVPSNLPPGDDWNNRNGGGPVSVMTYAYFTQLPIHSVYIELCARVSV